MIKLLVPFIIFLLGLYISLNYSSHSFKDGFVGDDDNCPDLLVQQGTELHLLNTKKAKIPGVNPIKFENLEEYVEYLDWQNYHGIKCPVLHFQKQYDAQGQEIYKIKDYISDELDLPISQKYDAEISELMDANYNGNKNLHFQGYDKDNQYIGQYNKLDQKFNEDCKGINLNAMHTCWSGEEASKNAFPDKIN
tara:strand:- start:209 stop:787 length:579 start_codon:yes stop_codon:yes gene_type:complete